MRWRRTRTERPASTEGASATASGQAFSETEWRAVRALRACYRRDHYLLAGQDVARLQFARWLVETGRLRA